MRAKAKSEEEARKMREEAEERRINSKIKLTPIEQAIISHLQNHGSSKMEDIIASAPLAHLMEEELESMERRGYLVEKEGYYFIARKKKYL
jgi:hypothetical protein